MSKTDLETIDKLTYTQLTELFFSYYNQEETEVSKYVMYKMQAFASKYSGRELEYEQAIKICDKIYASASND